MANHDFPVERVEQIHPTEVAGLVLLGISPFRGLSQLGLHEPWCHSQFKSSYIYHNWLLP